MQCEDVKRVAMYYRAIPGMLRLLRQEQAELEEGYNGLRGLAADGMPHGSSPGKPTEAMGIQAAEHGVGSRLGEIEEQMRVLASDAAAIRSCLDTLNDKYKHVILMRYAYGYSWAKTAMRMRAPDSTVRNWHDKAMERFGEVLEELPNSGEIVARASHART